MPFTGGAEDPPDEEVHLLAEQRVLRLQRRHGRQRRFQLVGEFGFAGHHERCVYMRKLLAVITLEKGRLRYSR